MVLDLVGLQLSVPDFIWTLINFFLLMFLLNKFLFKPVLAFMDERKTRIDAGLEEGRRAQAALKENEERLAAELSAKGEEARTVLTNARGEAEKQRGEMLDKAHAEAEELRRQARERVRASEKTAETEVENSMPELVAMLSDTLLGSSEASDNSELIKSCIEENRE